MARFTEKKDAAADKKAGIKEGSKRDIALDKQRGLPADVGAGNKGRFGGKQASPFGKKAGAPKKTRRGPF